MGFRTSYKTIGVEDVQVRVGPGGQTSIADFVTGEGIDADPVIEWERVQAADRDGVDRGKCFEEALRLAEATPERARIFVEKWGAPHLPARSYASIRNLQRYGAKLKAWYEAFERTAEGQLVSPATLSLISVAPKANDLSQWNALPDRTPEELRAWLANADSDSARLSMQRSRLAWFVRDHNVHLSTGRIPEWDDSGRRVKVESRGFMGIIAATLEAVWEQAEFGYARCGECGEFYSLEELGRRQPQAGRVPLCTEVECIKSRRAAHNRAAWAKNRERWRGSKPADSHANPDGRTHGAENAR